MIVEADHEANAYTMCRVTYNSHKCRGKASYTPSYLISFSVSYYGTAFNASSYLKINLLLTVLHYTVYSETLVPLQVYC